MSLPALHGNWIDLIIIVVVILYLWSGWSRGFILGVLDLGGFLLSFFLSLKLYSFAGQILADNFSLSWGIANAAGFLIVGFFAELVFSSLVNAFFHSFYKKIWQLLSEQKLISIIIRLDHFLGFIPAVGEAVIFTAFILTLLVTLPIQGRIKKDIISSKLGGPIVAQTSGIEQQLKTIFGQAVNETLTFLTVNPDPSSGERIDLHFTQADVKTDEAAEQTMLVLINKERVKANLKTLSVSIPLQRIARSYAKDMFVRGYFSHYNPEGQSPFDRMKENNISFLAAGENLALAPNINLAHQGLMNSPGHRANILSADFGKVGIGVVDGGIYGEMIVQEFAN